jgi:hypothetical protein
MDLGVSFSLAVVATVWSLDFSSAHDGETVWLLGMVVFLASGVTAATVWLFISSTASRRDTILLLNLLVGSCPFLLLRRDRETVWLLDMLLSLAVAAVG